jgi:hypothetical protein
MVISFHLVNVVRHASAMHPAMWLEMIFMKPCAGT